MPPIQAEDAKRRLLGGEREGKILCVLIHAPPNVHVILHFSTPSSGKSYPHTHFGYGLYSLHGCGALTGLAGFASEVQASRAFSFFRQATYLIADSVWSWVSSSFCMASLGCQDARYAVCRSILIRTRGGAPTGVILRAQLKVRWRTLAVMRVPTI
jgi:hypothetical protein